MTGQPQSLEDVEDRVRLRSALRTITACWALTLDPAHVSARKLTTTSNIARARPGSRLPVREGVLDARAAAAATLAAWTDLLLEVHGQAPRQPLSRHDVPALAAHLSEHVDALAAHPAAADAVAELTALARALDRMTTPDRPDAVFIGRCPVARTDRPVGGPRSRGRQGVEAVEDVRDDEAGPGECGARLYWPRAATSTACERCGTSDDVDGWLARMSQSTTSGPLTGQQLAAYLSRRCGREVTYAVVRKWTSQGQLAAVGKDARGRNLFDPVAALACAQRTRQRDHLRYRPRT
ncbi:hypothetical protein [Kineococcus terrestris]|uniref:hypothetical protein n=1 Tax=Kineococcus terrestris TaxID=2044856 RepID=UPI0034DAF451